MKPSVASMTSTVSLASKNKKLLSLYALSDFPGISSLSSLNDFNNLSGFNKLKASSENLLSLMFPSTLVSKCGTDRQKS